MRGKGGGHEWVFKKKYALCHFYLMEAINDLRA